MSEAFCLPSKKDAHVSNIEEVGRSSRNPPLNNVGQLCVHMYAAPFFCSAPFRMNSCMDVGLLKAGENKMTRTL